MMLRVVERWSRSSLVARTRCDRLYVYSWYVDVCTYTFNKSSTTTVYVIYISTIYMSTYIHNFLITKKFYLIIFFHIKIFDHTLFSPPGWSVINFPPLSTSDTFTISIYISTKHTYIHVSVTDIHSITSCSRHPAGAWSPFHHCLHQIYPQYLSIYRQ